MHKQKCFVIDKKYDSIILYGYLFSSVLDKKIILWRQLLLYWGSLRSSADTSDIMSEIYFYQIHSLIGV